jgi:REP element-mobilizing transposase RayT
VSPNRPPRAPGFSYVGFHHYFVTICTAHRSACFTEPEAARWLAGQILRLFKPQAFAVVAFCVMPDHAHLLLEGLSEVADLRAAIHALKLRTGHAWKQRTGHRLWQEGFHDYVLRDQDSVPALVRYILENPVRAGLVEDAAQYPHVGSSRYSMGALIDACRWQPVWKRRP